LWIPKKIDLKLSLDGLENLKQNCLGMW
jgi:hypothetical protein